VKAIASVWVLGMGWEVNWELGTGKRSASRMLINRFKLQPPTP